MTRPIPMQRGFTMLEVLVSLLILLIGLLGLAGLLVTTQQGEVEAYQRKQAAVLLQDMLDRITANPVAATCYAKTTDLANGAPSLGTGNAVNAAFTCAAGSVSQQARGSADLAAWNNALLGTSERKGAAEVGAIIDARGCVSNPASGVYVVSVAWRGLQPTVVPRPASVDVNGDGTNDFNVHCGVNQYTDERLRRVISVTVRIANLT